MTEIIIRQAGLSDLPVLVDLYALLDIGPTKQLSLDEAQRQFSRYEEYPNYRVYVAVVGEQLVGTFALIIIESLAHGGTPFAIVEDVVVREDWQGKKIGQTMMHFAMARCADAGCYKLALSSHLQRKRAHEFYESLGFNKHGFSFLITQD